MFVVGKDHCMRTEMPETEVVTREIYAGTSSALMVTTLEKLPQPRAFNALILT